jgi:hypothetical protein
LNAEQGGRNRLGERDSTSRCRPAKCAAALEKIEEAIQAVELCERDLTADGYRGLSKQGHLKDNWKGQLP